jgi:PAS domain S-box-containing protein
MKNPKTAKRFADADPEKTGVVLQAKSGTRKPVGRQLTRELTLIKPLLDIIPDKLYFKDLESRFISISRSQAKILGLKDPSQAVGKTDFDYFSIEHAQMAYDDEQEIIRTGKPLIKEEKETWPDRPDTWVLTTKLPLRDGKGKTIGTYGISRDITEHKLAEKALRLQAARAQIAAELARAGSATMDLGQLLSQVVNLIRDRFEFYHVAVYLLGLAGEGPLLRAASGQSSEQLGASEYRLPAGPQSLVGLVISSGQPRVIQDTNAQADFSSQADLSKVRSEAVVPLLAGKTVIGALDVQSAEANTFSPETVFILSTMAYHVATSVQNSRLFEQAYSARQQAEARVRELEIMLRVVRSASGSLELEHVLDALFDVLSKEMGYLLNKKRKAW